MDIKRNKTYRAFVGVVNTCFPILMAKMRYRKIFGKSLNLKNPQDLNEKMHWLSLYSDVTEWTRLADKYAVRSFVQERGLDYILNPLYAKWDTIDEVNWEGLPNSFVLKSNNGSGTVKLVPDKSALNLKETEKMLDKWLHMPYGNETTEFHYQDIKPCLLVEHLLENTPEDDKYSSTIVDYKVWCINGSAMYIWTVSNRRQGGFDGTLFDREWNRIPDAVKNNPHVRVPKVFLPKPANLDEMINVAETLAKGFPEVRVDLYNIGGHIYFGEMTFTTHGCTIDYLKPSLLMEMGQKIDISSIEKVRNVHRIL